MIFQCSPKFYFGHSSIIGNLPVIKIARNKISGYSSTFKTNLHSRIFQIRRSVYAGAALKYCTGTEVMVIT